ncbi:MAG: hypothetical protein ACTFAK_12600 [Candidatus Electronema sp. VV]
MLFLIEIEGQQEECAAGQDSFPFEKESCGENDLLPILILTFATATTTAVIIIIMMHGAGGQEAEGGKQRKGHFHEVFHSDSYWFLR